MRRAESVAVAAVLVLLLALTSLDLTGHRLFVVGGASMEPAIGKGSLVIVRTTYPAALTVGDVVTYQHRGATVTHRIAAVEEYGDARVFTTKGDANEAADPDPVAFDDRVGLVVAQLPVLGYLVAVLQSFGRPLSLAAALVIALWALRRARSRSFPLPATA
jgi:signal peptidase I